MDHKKYRVNYSSLLLNTNNFGIGYIDWDDTNFYFTNKKDEVITIPIANLRVSSNPYRVSKLDFAFKSTSENIKYGIYFLGSKETATLGVSQDMHEQSREFVKFVVAHVPEPPANFKADGSHDIKKASKKFFILLAVVLALFAAAVILLN